MLLYLMEHVPAAGNGRCWELAIDPGAANAVARSMISLVPVQIMMRRVSRSSRW